jgi:glycine dehydrogenase
MTTTTVARPHGQLDHTDRFVRRHIGPSPLEVRQMLAYLEVSSLDELIDRTIPKGIRVERPLDLPAPATEMEALAEIRALGAQNQIWRSYIGTGYSNTVVPPVIQRNVFENPGWYTQYTPYQAEIAQGRLEALLAFQTMVADLTGMEISNSSLLDEATAAAEAMHLCFAVNRRSESNVFFVSAACNPQTISVIQTRAKALDIDVVVGDPDAFDFPNGAVGALVPYPTTGGRVLDYRDFAQKAHDAGALVVAVVDLMSLLLLTPPGEWGADAVVGSSQRFGVPLGYGGPHAAFLATTDAYKRQMPGRIVGVSQDADGGRSYRLALQTREQHIRRERATSNICTAQVLLAIMAAFYAVYHGPDGLRRIAERIHRLTVLLAEGLRRLGYDLGTDPFFDTLTVPLDAARRTAVLAAATERRINLRVDRPDSLGVALDETTTATDLQDLLDVFAAGGTEPVALDDLPVDADIAYAQPFARTSEFLTHPVFHRYHSETEFMRFAHRLQSGDLSLTTSMIPLGSCTMKLNAAAEMMPLSTAAFGGIHPFAPVAQAAGYQELFHQLGTWLAEITGFAAVSFMPNAGAQGEYAGMLVIREFHEQRGEGHRKVCLIPASAHGTNPASAVMAGMQVVVVSCDDHGNVDVEDLRAKAEKHADQLAAIMVTYPSTHGVFEQDIREICRIVHAAGGQVYLDGANLNAQVALCRPGDYGADVCHLNLHKTFAIPHGGGGPGMGPIAVAEHLAPYLPTHPEVATGGSDGIGPVSSAPFGSSSILTISWAYIRMMGEPGLKQATQVAILNANYMAQRLETYYPTLYKGANGFVAHEFIADMRDFKKTAGIVVEDIAKRLMDYGFHAPTVSFPVLETMMIEPTESESKEELDRLVDALIAIRQEIQDIVDGKSDRADNLLKNAPHTAKHVCSSEWTHPYSREQAAYPAEWVKRHKFWPPVARIDNVYGDRHLMCTCPPLASYAS